MNADFLRTLPNDLTLKCSIIELREQQKALISFTIKSSTNTEANLCAESNTLDD